MRAIDLATGISKDLILERNKTTVGTQSMDQCGGDIWLRCSMIDLDGKLSPGSESEDPGLMGRSG